MTSPRTTYSRTKRARYIAWIIRKAPGLIALSLMLNILPAKAQHAVEDARNTGDCSADKQVTFRGGTVRLENDLFANTDQNYTNGLAFTAVSRDIAGRLETDCLPVPVQLHAQLIKLVNPEFWSDAENAAQTQNVVVKFGQSMYTPQDRTRTDLITEDRPYAGLLYVGLSWNRRKHEPENNTEMLDTREITLGVIGPWSFAEESQNVVHDAIGSERFLGWHHQLENEPAFQFAFDRKYKDFAGQGAITPGFSAETIRSLGFRLGNIETSATLGIEGRMGWNLPNDFGSYPIRPGAENRAPSAAAAAAIHGEPGTSAPAPKLRPGIHVFAMIETKLVAYDFSLDGNLFRDSHGVTRRPYVAQAAAGLSMHGVLWENGYRLAVMRVYRSREFEEQQTNHAFGSIALSIEF